MRRSGRSMNRQDRETEGLLLRLQAQAAVVKLDKSISYRYTVMYESINLHLHLSTTIMYDMSSV